MVSFLDSSDAANALLVNHYSYKKQVRLNPNLIQQGPSFGAAPNTLHQRNTKLRPDNPGQDGFTLLHLKYLSSKLFEYKIPILLFPALIISSANSVGKIQAGILDCGLKLSLLTAATVPCFQLSPPKQHPL